MSNAQLLLDLYRSFAEGDVPTVLASFDPAIAWSEAEGNPYMPTGEAWIGPEAVLENLFVKLGEDWDGFTVTPRETHDAGDTGDTGDAGGTVVVEGRYSGTCKATGRALDAQFCHVWTLRGGKITAFQQYVDTAQLQHAMGA